MISLLIVNQVIFFPQVLLPLQDLPVHPVGRDCDERAPAQVPLALQDGAEEGRVGDGRAQRLPLQDLRLCRDAQARRHRRAREEAARHQPHQLLRAVRVRRVRL